jgi:hypothetical protein
MPDRSRRPTPDDRLPVARSPPARFDDEADRRWLSGGSPVSDDEIRRPFASFSAKYVVILRTFVPAET